MRTKTGRLGKRYLPRVAYGAGGEDAPLLDRNAGQDAEEEKRTLETWEAVERQVTCHPLALSQTNQTQRFGDSGPVFAARSTNFPAHPACQLENSLTVNAELLAPPSSPRFSSPILFGARPEHAVERQGEGRVSVRKVTISPVPGTAPHSPTCIQGAPAFSSGSLALPQQPGLRIKYIQAVMNTRRCALY